MAEFERETVAVRARLARQLERSAEVNRHDVYADNGYFFDDVRACVGVEGRALLTERLRASGAAVDAFDFLADVVTKWPGRDEEVTALAHLNECLAPYGMALEVG